jgi:hypothetical protein
MDISFIVRKKVELEAAGAKILQTAASLEQVEQTLGGAGKRKRLYDPVQGTLGQGADTHQEVTDHPKWSRNSEPWTWVNE